MDKESQTRIALQRTIAGEDFSNLSRQMDPVKVFSTLGDGRKQIRPEDVFKDPHAEPVQAVPRRPVVFEVRRKRLPFGPKP